MYKNEKIQKKYFNSFGFVFLFLLVPFASSLLVFVYVFLPFYMVYLYYLYSVYILNL